MGNVNRDDFVDAGDALLLGMLLVVSMGRGVLDSDLQTSRGTMNQKVVPWLAKLRNPIWPPICSTRSLQMLSPG